MKKEALIHFPFYCNQYLGVMSELSAKERGFWITLLATFVVSDGVFPPKNRLYKRCDSCSEKDEEIIDNLLPEIEEIGNGIILKQKKLSKVRAKSGSKGGKANAKQMLSKSVAKGVAKGKHTETETDTLKSKPKNDFFDSCIDNVINHLNLVSSSSYKSSTESTRKIITARLKEGYTLQDLCDVIDFKLQDNHFVEGGYMRPQTLFNQTKFESYYNAAKRSNFVDNKKRDLGIMKMKAEDIDGI